MDQQRTDQYPVPPFGSPAAVLAPPRRRRTGLVVLLLILGVLVVAGGTAAAVLAFVGKPAGSGPATFTVTGQLILRDSPGVLNLDDVHCKGMNGYEDVDGGTEVTVQDNTGAVIAVGVLEQGKMIGSGLTRQCGFDFTVTGVPAGKGIYGVGVGHRGVQHFNEADLHGTVRLGLG